MSVNAASDFLGLIVKKLMPALLHRVQIMVFVWICLKVMMETLTSVYAPMVSSLISCFDELIQEKLNNFHFLYKFSQDITGKIAKQKLILVVHRNV